MDDQNVENKASEAPSAPALPRLSSLKMDLGIELGTNVPARPQTVTAMRSTEKDDEEDNLDLELSLSTKSITALEKQREGKESLDEPLSPMNSGDTPTASALDKYGLKENPVSNEIGNRPSEVVKGGELDLMLSVDSDSEQKDDKLSDTSAAEVISQLAPLTKIVSTRNKQLSMSGMENGGIDAVEPKPAAAESRNNYVETRYNPASSPKDGSRSIANGGMAKAGPRSDKNDVTAKPNRRRSSLIAAGIPQNRGSIVGTPSNRTSTSSQPLSPNSVAGNIGTFGRGSIVNTNQRKSTVTSGFISHRGSSSVTPKSANRILASHALHPEASTTSLSDPDSSNLAEIANESTAENITSTLGKEDEQNIEVEALGGLPVIAQTQPESVLVESPSESSLFSVSQSPFVSGAAGNSSVSERESRRLNREPSFARLASPTPSATQQPATAGGSLDQRVAKFKEAAEAAEAKAKKAEERSAGAARREGKLKSELTSFQKRISELEAELEGEKKATAEAEAAKAKFVLDLQQCEEKNDETLREVSRLSGALIDCERRARDFAAKADEDRRRLDAERERERERERSMRQELEEQLVSSNAQKESLTEKLVQLKRDKHDISSKLMEVESQLRAANETLMTRDQSKAEQKINQLNELLAALKEQVGDLTVSKSRYQNLLKYTCVSTFVREFRARANLAPLYTRLAEISAAALREESRGEQLGWVDYTWNPPSNRSSVSSDISGAGSPGPSSAVIAAAVASSLPRSIAAGASVGFRKTISDVSGPAALISAFARTSVRHPFPWLINPDREPGPPRCSEIVDAIEGEVSTLEGSFEMLKLQKRRWQELTGIFMRRNADLAQNLWKAREDLKEAQIKAEAAQETARESEELKLRLLQLTTIDSKTRQLSDKRASLAQENELIFRKCRVEEFQLLFNKTVHLRRRAARFAEKLRSLLQQHRNLSLSTPNANSRRDSPSATTASTRKASVDETDDGSKNIAVQRMPREENSKARRLNLENIEKEPQGNRESQSVRLSTSPKVTRVSTSPAYQGSKKRETVESGHPELSNQDTLSLTGDKQRSRIVRRDRFITELQSSVLKQNSQDSSSPPFTLPPTDRSRNRPKPVLGIASDKSQAWEVEEVKSIERYTPQDDETQLRKDASSSLSHNHEKITRAHTSQSIAPNQSQHSTEEFSARRAKLFADMKRAYGFESAATKVSSRETQRAKPVPI